MSQQQPSRKAFISVVEMATEVLNLSESRFHALIKAGVFPKPKRHEGCKRPVFDLELQQKCIEIRQTGIGNNGQPVVFNRMRATRKPRTRQQRQLLIENRTDDHGDLIEALKSLGLTTTGDDVQAALRELYPTGTAGVDQGELIRKLFLHLRGKR